VQYPAIINSSSKLVESKSPGLYFSRYLPDTHSHGGTRRTAQIVDLLKGVDYEFIAADNYQYLPIEDSCIEKLFCKLPKYCQFIESKRKEQITAGVYWKWAASKRDYLYGLNKLAHHWQQVLQSNNHLQFVIVDDPIYFAPLIRFLHTRNVTIIAHCHNIETLSTPQVIPKYQQELLSYELDLLTKCQSILTISREETFLLQNLGKQPLYIPYYPVAKIRDRLLSIRERRKAIEKRNILLIGTVGNLPTFNGMTKIIRDWQKGFSSSSCKDNLIVAGFGTEQLQEHVTGNGVSLKGVLSDGELDQLLAQVKATVVYQESGSGALTKICEFLVAGIPVYANHHAARSYYNMPGIIEFNDIIEVVTGLEQVKDIENKIMIPAEPDYRELLSLVSKFTNLNQ